MLIKCGCLSRAIMCLFSFQTRYRDKIVASMTNPKTGVMQKLIRRPATPIWNISPVPPNAARICLGKNSTASQIIQVMETENMVA